MISGLIFIALFFGYPYSYSLVILWILLIVMNVVKKHPARLNIRTVQNAWAGKT